MSNDKQSPPDAPKPTDDAAHLGGPTKGRRPSTTPRKSAIPGSLLMVSARQKMDLAQAALKLRDEQVSARVVFFEPEQKTNAELDKITESVIAELRAIQSVRGPTNPGVKRDRAGELAHALKGRLESLLDPRRGTFLRAKLDTLSRRITTLFFEAALGHHATPDELAARVISLPEQALYYAVARNKAQIVDDLQSLNYDSEEVYNDALDRLARLEKELQISLLARKAPELEKLLPVVIEVFTEFLTERFRAGLAEFTREVVAATDVARNEQTGSVRIEAKWFQRFREVFERGFLERMVMDVQEPLITRLDAMEADEHVFHTETLDFIADPRVFSVVCGVMCDAFYDALHSDGLLDLPPEWRTPHDVSTVSTLSRVAAAPIPPMKR